MPQIFPSENLLKIPPYYYFEDEPCRHNINRDWLQRAIRKVHLERELDLTLVVYLKHLRKVHSKFFAVHNAEQGLADLDAKFFVRKLKNEVFTCHEIIAFDQILSSDADLTNSFEAQICQKFNLMFTKNFALELQKYAQAQAIMLVPDKLSARHE